jgi:hypothetical protein
VKRKECYHDKTQKKTIKERPERVFHRMLWLNPSDNEGVRFLIDDVKSKTAWEARENE